jgi:hypothetical protein
MSDVSANRARQIAESSNSFLLLELEHAREHGEFEFAALISKALADRGVVVTYRPAHRSSSQYPSSSDRRRK